MLTKKVNMYGGYIDSLRTIHKSKVKKFLFLAYAALREGGTTFFRRLVFL